MQTEALPVQAPVQEAHIETFGPSLMDLDQEIWVTLQRGVPPSRVVDLSVFGPFKPGMTHDQAVAVAGQPTRTWRDEYEQSWFEFDRAQGKVHIGCECSSSGSLVTTNCLWRLYALRPVVRPETGLDPQLVGFVAAGRRVPGNVTSQTLQLNTADNGEFVTWPAEGWRGARRILWHDRNRSTRGGRCKGAA